MLFNKDKIKEALEYYNIKDIDYQEKCNRCIDEINNNKKIQGKINEIYEILYIDKTEKLRELWKIKDTRILFAEEVNPLEYHKENIKKYDFDKEQMTE